MSATKRRSRKTTKRYESVQHSGILPEVDIDFFSAQHETEKNKNRNNI